MNNKKILDTIAYSARMYYKDFTNIKVSSSLIKDHPDVKKIKTDDIFTYILDAPEYDTNFYATCNYINPYYYKAPSKQAANVDDKIEKLTDWLEQASYNAKQEWNSDTLYISENLFNEVLKNCSKIYDIVPVIDNRYVTLLTELGVTLRIGENLKDYDTSVSIGGGVTRLTNFPLAPHVFTFDGQMEIIKSMASDCAAHVVQIPYLTYIRLVKTNNSQQSNKLIINDVVYVSNEDLKSISYYGPEGVTHNIPIEYDILKNGKSILSQKSSDYRTPDPLTEFVLPVGDPDEIVMKNYPTDKELENMGLVESIQAELEYITDYEPSPTGTVPNLELSDTSIIKSFIEAGVIFVIPHYSDEMYEECQYLGETKDAIVQKAYELYSQGALVEGFYRILNHD